MGKSLRNRQQFHGRTHGFQKFSSDFSSSQGFMRWVAGCYRQLGFGLMGHFLFEAVEPPMVGCWPSSHVKSSMDFPQTIQLLGYPHDCGKPHLHPLYCNFRSNIIFHTSIWISQIGIIQRHPTSLSRSIRDSSFYVMSGPVLCALNPHSQSLSTHIESYIYIHTIIYIYNYIYNIYTYIYIYKNQVSSGWKPGSVVAARAARRSLWCRHPWPDVPTRHGRIAMEAWMVRL